MSVSLIPLICTLVPFLFLLFMPAVSANISLHYFTDTTCSSTYGTLYNRVLNNTCTDSQFWNNIFLLNCFSDDTFILQVFDTAQQCGPGLTSDLQANGVGDTSCVQLGDSHSVQVNCSAAPTTYDRALAITTLQPVSNPYDLPCITSMIDISNWRLDRTLPDVSNIAYWTSVFCYEAIGTIEQCFLTRQVYSASDDPYSTGVPLLSQQVYSHWGSSNDYRISWNFGTSSQFLYGHATYFNQSQNGFILRAPVNALLGLQRDRSGSSLDVLTYELSYSQGVVSTDTRNVVLTLCTADDATLFVLDNVIGISRVDFNAQSMRILVENNAYYNTIYYMQYDSSRHLLYFITGASSSDAYHHTASSSLTSMWSLNVTSPNSNAEPQLIGPSLNVFSFTLNSANTYLYFPQFDFQCHTRAGLYRLPTATLSDASVQLELIAPDFEYDGHYDMGEGFTPEILYYAAYLTDNNQISFNAINLTCAALEQMKPFVSGISQPFGMTFRENTLYVANDAAKSIVAVNITSGELSTFTQGFNETTGLIYESSTDSLYVSQGGSRTISAVSFTDSTTINTVVDGFDDAGNIVTDNAGTLYVLDQGVWKVSIADQTRTLIASIPNSVSIAINSIGNLYVSNYSSNNPIGSIWEVSPDGSFINEYLSGLSAPAGLAFDLGDVLYVVSSGDKSILRVTGQLSGGNVTSTVIAQDRFGLSGPFNAIVDPSNCHLWVGNLNGASVSRVPITWTTPLLQNTQDITPIVVATVVGGTVGISIVSLLFSVACKCRSVVKQLRIGVLSVVTMNDAEKQNFQLRFFNTNSSILLTLALILTSPIQLLSTLAPYLEVFNPFQPIILYYSIHKQFNQIKIGHVLMRFNAKLSTFCAKWYKFYILNILTLGLYSICGEFELFHWMDEQIELYEAPAENTSLDASNNSKSPDAENKQQLQPITCDPAMKRVVFFSSRVRWATRISCCLRTLFTLGLYYPIACARFHNDRFRHIFIHSYSFEFTPIDDGQLFKTFWRGMLTLSSAKFDQFLDDHTLIYHHGQMHVKDKQLDEIVQKT